MIYIELSLNNIVVCVLPRALIQRGFLLSKHLKTAQVECPSQPRNSLTVSQPINKESLYHSQEQGSVVTSLAVS